MSSSTLLKVRQLSIIVVAWVMIGFIMAVYDHLVIHTSNSLGPSPDYSFLLLAIRNIGGGLIGSLIGGSFLVFGVNVKYQDKPYGYTILAVGVAFLLIIAFITLVMGITMVPYQTGKPLAHPVTQAALFAFLRDPSHLKAAVAWSLVVAVTQLLLQVSFKFGQGTFWDMIRGKYNLPKAERRIFMFVDLNASTTIAERLGNETYHALLKDFFADITNPILDNKGSIYQYVGDEVVVSWRYEEGIEKASCIRCFFAMKREIEQKQARYLRQYGLVPTFKAGIHGGSVIAGEVGILKRDVTFSGDVLNTTARIQSKCKEFNVELIASEELVGQLPLADHFTVHSLGTIKLRGKQQEIQLRALQPLA